MTAPSTFNVTGTFLDADGSTPLVGTVTFRPTVARFINNGNVINAKEKVVTLDGSGTIGTVTLIQATAGYEMMTNFVGKAPAQSHIAGTANLSVTPSAGSSMTVTGTLYTADNALAPAGSKVTFTRVSTGSTHTALTSSGAFSIVLKQDALGYDVREFTAGQWYTPSYHIAAATSTLDLSTV